MENKDLFTPTGGIAILTGTTNPEGVVSASIGREYFNTVTNTLFKKTSSTGNTGWVSLSGGSLSGGFDAVPLGTQFFGVNPPQPSSIFIQTNNGTAGFTYLKSEYEELWSAADLDSVADGEWSQNFCYPIQRVNSTTFKPEDRSGYIARIHDTSGTIDPDGATRVVGDLQDCAVQFHKHTLPLQQNPGWSTASATTMFGQDNYGNPTKNEFYPQDNPEGNEVYSLTDDKTTKSPENEAFSKETRPKNYSQNHYIKAKTRGPITNELIDGENSTVTTEEVGGVMQTRVDVVLPNVLNPNLFINGDFQVWQRGESIEHPGGLNVILYGSDTDFFRRGSNHAGQVVSKQFDAVYGNIARIQRKEGNSLTGELNYARCMESIDVEKYAGKTITVSEWIKMSTGFLSNTGTVTMNIHTGTVANEGPSTNTASPYGFSTGGVLVGSISSNTTKGVWQKLIRTVAIPANAKSLLVQTTHSSMTGTAGVDDYYEIAQIKVELGSQTTAFSSVSYGIELERCKRRFERIQREGTNLTAICNGFRETNTLFSGLLEYKTKRIIPTISYSGLNHFVVNALSDLDSTNITHTEVGVSTALLQVTTGTGTAGNPGILQFNSTGNPGYIDINAEI